jgi:deoxyinosine 3'endonuclease (endonuclease V)
MPAPAIRIAGTALVYGEAGWPYEPGLLALREGRLLEAPVRALPERPEGLIVNAGGRDHPRRAGLALHLGAALDLPSMGITDRPLLAEGPPPGPARRSDQPAAARRPRGGALAAYARGRTPGRRASRLANRPRHGDDGRLAGDPEGAHSGAPSPGPQGGARGPGGAVDR